MYRHLLLLFLSLPLFSLSQAPVTVFEKSAGKKTPTYPEIISWWQKMDAASPFVQVQTIGSTDAGYPLHLVLVSKDKDFSIASIKKKKKSIILINNGIHPGEPDGIDASMLLVRDLVTQQKTKALKEPNSTSFFGYQSVNLPDNVVLAIIPVYNIGGALNRSTHYRVDQNGPEEIGFRGNAQNLDLNRDFIKCDSKNARSFTQLFHQLDPDIFVDNHVSNGADYQHVMTLIASQHNRLGGKMGTFMNKQFEPALYTLMKEKGFDLVPYVNHFGETPEQGWTEFWDSPRYSSGYASLCNTFAFVPETHMLKPYEERVKATYALMQSFIEFTSKHTADIITLRNEQKKEQVTKASFPLGWKLDKSRFTDITFKGYASGKKTSAISGLPRLYYDRTRPYTKQIPFYNYYVDTFSVIKPKAYIIPQGWWKVIELLQLNKVKMSRLSSDTTLEVEMYRIENYTSSPRPFEGHHPNREVKTSSKTIKKVFRKGDYLIPMNQAANRFIIEVLEPRAEDSYFAWNYFDPILTQKEGYSDYVFEETALTYLQNDEELKNKLQHKKNIDSVFANNGSAQLNFIYQNSPYYEPAHLQYPVYRILK